MEEAGREKYGGRQKGTPNKVTSEIRERYKEFVQGNLENLDLWLERVSEHDPDKALDFMLKFSEYFIPKLQRTELTGDDGKPLVPDKVTIEIVQSGPKISTNEKEADV